MKQKDNRIMERMWIHHERAQKARNGRTSKRELGMVGIQELCETEGGRQDAKLESTYGQGKRGRKEEGTGYEEWGS